MDATRTTDAVTRTTRTSAGAARPVDGTMRAVVLRAYGGPEVLTPTRLPVPEPAAGEVLVRVHAAGVNPADWRIRSGEIRRFGEPPFVLGFDLAGTVAGLGPGATRFRLGDRVLGVVLPTRGSYAEYVAVPEVQLAAVPDSVALRDAAALPVAGLTAWQALGAARVTEGSRVLVHAAAGGVGHFAVQFAKARGAHVIGTARADNHALLRDLGVDEVIDYTATDFVEQLTAAPGSRVDAVVDPISGAYGLRSLDVLRPGGVLVDVRGSLADDRTALRARAAERGVRLVELGFTPSGADLAEIAALAEKGAVRVALDRVFPLARAAEAHAAIATGRTRGKLVLAVDEAGAGG